MDVVNALAEEGATGITVGGRPLRPGSKDTPPASAFAVYEELKKDAPAREFTVGIVDDVTNLSLPEDRNCPNTAAEGTKCKFWGLGGDGTVGANNVLHQDDRRPHRQVRAGLLPVRLQEDGRRHHQPPALRRRAHPLALLRQQGRLRRLPHALLHNQGLPDRLRHQARRHFLGELRMGRRRAFAPHVQEGQAIHQGQRHQALHDSTRSTSPSRSAWASAPTPSCSRRSSRWPT